MFNSICSLSPLSVYPFDAHNFASRSGVVPINTTKRKDLEEGVKNLIGEQKSCVKRVMRWTKGGVMVKRVVRW